MPVETTSPSRLNDTCPSTGAWSSSRADTDPRTKDAEEPLSATVSPKVMSQPAIRLSTIFSAGRTSTPYRAR